MLDRRQFLAGLGAAAIATGSANQLWAAAIKPDEASAEIRHGLLTVRLPKIDKQKQTKVKIKTV